MSCAHSLPRMLAGVCICVYATSFFFRSCFCLFFFNPFQSVRFWCVDFSLSHSLHRSVVVHELITCHVPMVIIMTITIIVCVYADICKGKCIETRAQLWMTNSTTINSGSAVEVHMICATPLDFVKMHCLWLSACASLQLCHCSIHFGRIPLFLFLIFLERARVRYCIFFCFCYRKLIFCLFPSYFSAFFSFLHSLRTIVYWMREMKNMVWSIILVNCCCCRRSLLFEKRVFSCSREKKRQVTIKIDERNHDK